MKILEKKEVDIKMECLIRENSEKVNLRCDDNCYLK